MWGKVRLAFFAAAALVAAAGLSGSQAYPFDDACARHADVPEGDFDAGLDTTCLAHRDHVRAVAEMPRGSRVMQLFVDTLRDGVLLIELDWNRDGSVRATATDESYRGQRVVFSLDSAAGNDIAKLFESFSAPTREAEVLRRTADDNATSGPVCAGGNYTAIASNETGTLRTGSGYGCGGVWPLLVAELVAEKLLPTRPACAELRLNDQPLDDIDAVAICTRLIGDAKLARRVFDSQALVMARYHAGGAYPPPHPETVAWPNVRISFAGVAETSGPQGLHDAVAALTAKPVEIDATIFWVAEKRGTVEVSGNYILYGVDKAPIRTAWFTQVWRVDRTGTPKLVSWTIGPIIKAPWAE